MQNDECRMQNKERRKQANRVQLSVICIAETASRFQTKRSVGKLK
jgi:hypothetical protein